MKKGETVMRYRNTSPEHRTWPSLVNAETGTTLELAPGETAEIDGDVNDPRLKPEPKPKPEPELKSKD